MRVRLTTEEGRLRVEAPYNTLFSRRARNLGGTWSALHRVWTFHPRVERDVRRVCRDIYGDDGDGPPDTVVLRALALRKVVSGRRSGILLGGRPIASASGRDTGARVGQDRVLESGSIDSGGSRENWVTTMAAGTRVRVYDMPRKWYEQGKWNRKARQITLVDDEAAERESLLSRRARLEEEIRKIDAALAREQDNPPLSPRSRGKRG